MVIPLDVYLQPILPLTIHLFVALSFSVLFLQYPVFSIPFAFQRVLWSNGNGLIVNDACQRSLVQS